VRRPELVSGLPTSKTLIVRSAGSFFLTLAVLALAYKALA
jgi:hypothetical protein